MSTDLLALYLEQHGGLVKLRRYAKKLGHKFSLTKEDAMDLLNDALLNLTARADKFRCEQDGSPMIQMAKWAHSVLYNVFVDENRRRNVTRVNKDLEPVFMEDLPPETPDLLYEPLQETDDLRRDLRTAFLKIKDPENRLIADMVLVQGMTVREVAAVIDIPRSTVLDRLMIARDELRHILKEYRP